MTRRHPPVSPQRLRALRGLIVEPDVLRQWQLRQVLTALGLRRNGLAFVESTPAAAARLLKDRYDFCLVALDLPGGPAAFLERVRATPGGASLPVVVVGAGATRETVLPLAHAGVRGFLTLPLTVENVEQVLAGISP